MTRCLIALAAILALSTAPTFAGDPDSVLDPATGYIETASAWWNGTDQDIHLTTDRGVLSPVSVAVFDGTTEDFDPRIALTSSGALWVVWNHEAATDQVLLRGRSNLGVWGDVLLVSNAEETSSNAEILSDGDVTLLVYEVEDASSQSVAVVSIQDEPDPIGPRSIVATTSWSGSLDVRLHADSGHAWVTWIDDDKVGWSELSSGSWDAPSSEEIVEGDSEGARERVRATVLGN